MEIKKTSLTARGSDRRTNVAATARATCACARPHCATLPARPRRQRELSKHRVVMFVHVNGARLYFDVAMAAHTTRSKMWNNRSLSRKRPSRGPTPLVAGLNPNLLHVRDRRSQQGALGEHQRIPLNMHGPRVGQRPWLLATKSMLGSCSLLQALSRRRCTVLERKDHWF